MQILIFLLSLVVINVFFIKIFNYFLIIYVYFFKEIFVFKKFIYAFFVSKFTINLLNYDMLTVLKTISKLKDN